MKFKAPENCNEISIGGEVFRVDSDGNITVPEEGNYASLLIPHGFSVAENQDIVPVKTAKKEVVKKEKVEEEPVVETVSNPWKK